MLNYVGMLAVGVIFGSNAHPAHGEIRRILCDILDYMYVCLSFERWGDVPDCAASANVSVCFMPLEVLPGIFRYGHAFPFYNVSGGSTDNHIWDEEST